MAQRTSRSRAPKGNKGYKGPKGPKAEQGTETASRPRSENFKKDKNPAGKPAREEFKKDRNSSPRPAREEFTRDREPGQRPTRDEFRRDRRQGREEEGVEIVSNELMIIGRNAILEALNADRTIDKLFVQTGSNEGSIRKIIAEAKDKGILIQETEKIRLDGMAAGNGKHQGVIAYASAHEYVRVEDILAAAAAKGEDPFIIIMENIQDPHNLGAVIRTANAAGAHGVIIPKRRSVGLTSVVGKVSAGAIEYTPVAKVTNIVRTIEQLKKEGVWIACADMDGKVMYETDLKGPMALIIGSEGEGVSRLVKENCDYVVSMPMNGQIDSLNASVAAGLLMYEVVRQRKY